MQPHRLADSVWQPIFMAFLGRCDFYREYGFYLRQSVKMNGSYNYWPDTKRQAGCDEASMKLYDLRVSEVIAAASHDGVRYRTFVKPIIDSLVEVLHQPNMEFLRDYLKQFSDDWDNKCDEYVHTIEGLRRIPTIRRKYLDKLKITSPGSTLIWNESELETLNARLMKIQDVH